jgi:dTDP-4-amino-4,6-dideoxygalactose transaminase
MIQHSKPSLGKEEIKSLHEVISSGMIGTGPKTLQLEKLITKSTGCADSITVSSASLAIYAILKYLYPNGKKKVALSSYVCRSVYDAICMADCKPVLIDIDPYTFGIDIKKVLRLKTDAVIVAHLFGVKSDFSDLSGTGVEIIEDCAQRITPSPIKEKALSKWRVYSFEATKIITGGQGGVICGTEKKRMQELRMLLEGGYEYSHPCIKLPYTDLEAAVAIAQWKKLDKFLEIRKRTAEYYIETLIKNNLQHLIHSSMFLKDTLHFRFIVKVKSPDIIIRKMERKKIACSRPVKTGLHKLFKIQGSFKNTDNAMNTILSIPLYPELSHQQKSYVINQFIKVIESL